MIVDLESIMDILPQRYPFRFVDRVLSFDPKERKITCIKNFSMNEYFFSGHFPDNPVVPGVIMIEAMAQAAILLYGALKPDKAAQKPDFFLGRVESKFKKTVYPGDTLVIEVTASKILDSSGIVEAEAKVKDDVCAQTTIAFGVKAKT
ncbi:MAG TPA: 3-hydroxyacyl-ACP dehydratase FabZ [Candidatus Omnitrophota bacterium]|nr:3-hydroxyacyl-ACP dehydratase FabZ [Candidatus Omnitrophota bacterium]